MRALLLLRGSSNGSIRIIRSYRTSLNSSSTTLRRQTATTTMASHRSADAATATTTTPAPSFPSATALRTWLHQHGVPTDTWGTAAAKSVEDLLAEVAAGESALFEVVEGATPTTPPTTALRTVRVVSLLLSPPSSSSLVLAEASQVLPDGRVRRRGLLPLSEKMKGGEEGWEAAARRGVEEELASAATADQSPLVSLNLSSHVVELGPLRDAASYPGLPTRYEVHTARGKLSAAAFARVLPAPDGALLERRRRREGGGAVDDDNGSLEFETVEEVPGRGVHRTTWRWVEERELGGGGGQGGGGGAG
jgi:hypothetical protein